MKKPKPVYAPSDEVEAQSLMSLLSEEGIPYVELRKHDSSYPGIADWGKWGVILVDEPDLERARNLAADMVEAVLQANSSLDEGALADAALAAGRRGPAGTKQ